MAVITIVEAPNPILDKKTNKVRDFDQDLENLITNMHHTLDAASEPEGAGISANQIGVNKRVCIVRDFAPDPLDNTKTIFNEIVLVNPKIYHHSPDVTTDWEGCLSVPDTYGKVPRSLEIKIRYQDPSGNRKKLVAQGFLARVIQHEVDHLNGVLFTTKVQGDTVSGDFFEGNF
jgi:peptide deformylase